MKKYLALGFLLSSILSLGAEYSVNFGLDPYRQTTVSNTKESAGIGMSIGGEALLNKNNLYYGLGLEFRNKTKHGEYFDGENYYSSPVYGVLKYKLPEDFYLLGRLGRAFNTNRDITENSGNYFAIGGGKSVGNFDFEILHESTEIKNNDNDLNLKVSPGIYKDGNFETVSFKVAYVFGREEKDNIGPEISLDSKVEGNNVTWNYAVTEKKSKITKVYLNNKLVEGNGIYSAKELAPGTYTLDVVAQDNKGNETKKSNTIVIKAVEKVEPVIVVEKVVEKIEPVTIVEKVVEKVEPVVVEKKIEPVVVEKAEVKELKDFSKGLKSLPVIVGYGTNITQLTTEQKQRLEDAVNVLNGQKGTLSIIGYTDDSGSEKLNLKLSKQRADAVAGMVKSIIKNPQDIKIQTIGRGETSFKVPNTSEENRKLNRRIEFEFKADGGEIIKSQELTK